MLRQRSSRVLLGALCLIVALSACRFQGYGNAPVEASADKGVTWLKTQQQTDGGFEVAGFPGFETPDAVLAIASAAQTTYAWNKVTARNAVLATVKSGHTPLHALDDLAQSGIDAGQAAKLIALVTVPLGMSSTAFDPDGDGAQNLAATVDAGLRANGSYGLFNATLYAAIAKRSLNSTVQAATLAYIKGAQQANGGWNYSGLAGGADLDIDTTAAAIQALVAAGVPSADTDLNQGLAFLAIQQRADGSWQSFGSDDPNSTSTAVLAVTAAGFDVEISCWRNTVVPGLSANPYTSPLTWLRSRQATSGQFNSPNDAFGVNTFATSQSVQGLERNWLPLVPIAPRTCS
jgi:prenyltransferase beta subunit